MARPLATTLASYLQACPPFNWRTHNCTQFAAAWLRLVEGRAPRAPGVPGLYASRRVLKRLGVDLAGAVTLSLQRQPIPASQARPGDLALLQAPGQHQALGICTGRTAAVLTLTGIAHIEMAHMAMAWPVHPQ